MLLLLDESRLVLLEAHCPTLAEEDVVDDEDMLAMDGIRKDEVLEELGTPPPPPRRRDSDLDGARAGDVVKSSARWEAWLMEGHSCVNNGLAIGSDAVRGLAAVK
jgi:hypothetical protein